MTEGSGQAYAVVKPIQKVDGGLCNFISNCLLVSSHRCDKTMSGFSPTLFGVVVCAVVW